MMLKRSIYGKNNCGNRVLEIRRKKHRDIQPSTLTLVCPVPGRPLCVLSSSVMLLYITSGISNHDSLECDVEAEPKRAM